VDIYWRDTMYMVPWYLLVAAGSLALRVLVAAVVFFGWLSDRAQPKL
jgi:hypothetical protein